jgi:hypothetical protein
MGFIKAQYVHMLDGLQFDWSMARIPREKRWMVMLEALKHFYEMYGHCRIPLTHKNAENLKLGI